MNDALNDALNEALPRLRELFYTDSLPDNLNLEKMPDYIKRKVWWNQLVEIYVDALTVTPTESYYGVKGVLDTFIGENIGQDNLNYLDLMVIASKAPTWAGSFFYTENVAWGDYLPFTEIYHTLMLLPLNHSRKHEFNFNFPALSAYCHQPWEFLSSIYARHFPKYKLLQTQRPGMCWPSTWMSIIKAQNKQFLSFDYSLHHLFDFEDYLDKKFRPFKNDIMDREPFDIVNMSSAIFEIPEMFNVEHFRWVDPTTIPQKYYISLVSEDFFFSTNNFKITKHNFRDNANVVPYPNRARDPSPKALGILETYLKNVHLLTFIYDDKGFLTPLSTEYCISHGTEFDIVIDALSDF
jgi:hypothetical protein